VTIGYLKSVHGFRMGPDKDRHLLAGCTDAFNQSPVVRIAGAGDPVLGKGGINDARVELKHKLAIAGPKFQIFGPTRLSGQPVKIEAHGADRARRYATIGRRGGD
jgi:hypothetical protein